MTSIFLDLRTLSFVLMLVTISLSILMMLIWRTNRTYPGFGFWAIANISAAAGFLFIGLRGVIPDFVTVIIANGFAFGGVLFTFLGNRSFLGFSNGKVFSIISLILYVLGLTYIEYFDEKVIYRIVFTSLFVAVVNGRNAFDFRRGWLKEKSTTYRFAGAIYLIFSLMMIMRAGLTYSFSDMKDFYVPDWIQSSSFMMLIIFAIVWTFIYMILNNERLQQELKATKTEFERLATTDFLTGINNNRRFFEIGESEIQRAKRFRHPLTLIMFDIDYFKKVNDTYGHDAGDRVLIAIVNICKFNLRDLDVLGRLGGEEFGVLLPHADIDVGKMVAGRFRRAFAETEIELPLESIKVTASFGVTEFCESDTELKDLLNRADAALYEAKQNGRNQVKVASMVKRKVVASLSKLDSIKVM